MNRTCVQTCSLVAVLAAGALVQPAQAQVNLAANANFETANATFPFLGWRPLGANNFREGTNIRTGIGATFAFPGFFPGVQVGNPTGRNQTGWFNTYNIAPTAGAPVVASVWIRPNETIGVNVRAFASVSFFDGPDGTGNVVGTPFPTPVVDITNFAPIGTYRQVSANAVAPAGAQSATFAVICEQELDFTDNPVTGDYRGGSFQWDDASLTINAVETLPNPGFEVFSTEPFGTWTTNLGGLTSSGNVTRSGTRAARSDGPFFFCGNFSGPQQTIPVVEGRKYRAGVYIHHLAADAPNPDNMRSYIEVRFKDALGNELRIPGDLDNSFDVCVGPVLDVTNWKFTAVPTLTAPLDAVTMDIKPIQVQACFDGGASYFDDVRVQDLTCPGDFNQDNVRSPADIFAFLNSYFAGSDLADFNWDGVRQPADIFAFLNGYFAGC